MCTRLAILALLFMVSTSYGGLIHHYTFESDASSGAATTDSVGGAHGVLQGDTFVGGGVLNLDGNGDYVQFDMHIVPTTDSYTVAFFGREYSRPESFGTMISQGWTTSGNPPPEGFWIGRDLNGKLRVTDFNTTGFPFPTLPYPGGFHHFAVVVDHTGPESRVYVDGVVIATMGSAITTQASGTDTRFGRQFDSSAYTEYFHGALDDVRIYDSALTTDEIRALIIPEASSFLLASIGMAGLAAIRQRESSRRHSIRTA